MHLSSKLNLEDCEAGETLDDVRLLHAIIRNDADSLKAMDKIKVPFSEVAACFRKSLSQLGPIPRRFSPTGEPCGTPHGHKRMERDHRPLPHLLWV